MSRALLLPRLVPQTLVAFSDRRLRQRLGARFGLLYAVGIAASYGVMILVAGGLDDARTARALVVQQLETASWVVGGLIGLSLAANWNRLDHDDGVIALLRLRGLADDKLELARCYAAARRIALLVGGASLLCCALAGARARTLEAALSLAGLALGSVLYACVLGAAVSALAVTARWLLPSYGRLMLVLLVLLPHAAREIWPPLPSVPAGAGWLIALVGRAGGVSA